MVKMDVHSFFLQYFFMVPAYVLIACQKMSLSAEHGQVYGNHDRDGVKIKNKRHVLLVKTKSVIEQC